MLISLQGELRVFFLRLQMFGNPDYRLEESNIKIKKLSVNEILKKNIRRDFEKEKTRRLKSRLVFFSSIFRHGAFEVLEFERSMYEKYFFNF